VGRPGEGEGSLHLYHRSIWWLTDCALELSSFEMLVYVQQTTINMGWDGLLLKAGRQGAESEG
jgi:hypothetical protein